MPDINIGLNFGIGLIVLILVVVFSTIGATWASRYQRAGPDEVLIVSGRKHRTRDLAGNPIEVGFRVVRNGGTFVLPVVEQSQRMSLHVISTEVATRNAISKEGVPLLVAGTALFKVGSDDIGIMNAAERYLGRPRDDLERDVRAVLEGTSVASADSSRPRRFTRTGRPCRRRSRSRRRPSSARWASPSTRSRCARSATRWATSTPSGASARPR